MKCSECKFWHPVDDPVEPEQEDGLQQNCRRYPPSHYVAKYNQFEWPTTFAEEWCGEFLAK